MGIRRICGVALALFTTSAVMAERADSEAPTVETGRVFMVQEAMPRRYVGAVEPVEKVDIMPRVTGTLLKIHFREGAMVKAGDPLYDLEDTTYRATVEALEAQKEQLEAQLRFADLEFKRNQALLKNKAVAVSVYDKADLDIRAARAKIKEIGASLTDARNNLSYTRIVAPLSGRIGKSQFTVGNLITPAGGKLTDIEMVSPIYVRFSISERVFRREFGGRDGVREKAIIRVQTADGEIYPETARVTLIDNKINAATNTITLWAAFENRDHGLIPGGFVTVHAAAKMEKPLPAVLPSALIAGENGYSVFVLDAANRVSPRHVQIGDMSGKLQIVRSGLNGSERIVVDGTHKLRPGMTVRPVETAAPSGK